MLAPPRSASTLSAIASSESRLVTSTSIGTARPPLSDDLFGYVFRLG
jgi:hypothetical protein